MKTIHHHRDVLARETGHLVGRDRDQVQLMLILARLMAANLRHVPYDLAVEALALKLLTMHEGAERWVRILVAKAALEIVAEGQPLAA